MSNENESPKEMQPEELTLAGTPRKRALPKRRCSATSTTTGLPCKNPPIQGGTVCEFHGGKAPQVRAAAQRRLEAMLPKAQDVLEELLEQRDAPQVRLGAVKEVHDRVLGRPGDTGKGGDNRPLIQIGIGLTLPTDELSRLTVVETRAELPEAVEVIDAEPDEPTE